MSEQPEIASGGVLVIFGVCLGAIALVALLASVNPTPTSPPTPVNGQAVAWALAILPAAVGVIWLGVWLARKRRHVLAITTAAGEVRAVVSPDEAVVTAMLNAVNDAVISRG